MGFLRTGDAGRTAVVTGGASGIGLAVSEVSAALLWLLLFAALLWLPLVCPLANACKQLVQSDAPSTLAWPTAMPFGTPLGAK